MCADLVTLGPPNEDHADADREVQLAHESVKIFFEERAFQSGVTSAFALNQCDAHVVLAKHSLAYLVHMLKSSIETTAASNQYVLGSYVARYWHYHTSHFKNDRSKDAALVWHDVCNMFCEPDQMKNWLRIYDADRIQPRMWRRRGNDRQGNSLYYAALLGLGSVVELLLDRVMSPDAQATDLQGGTYGNALQAAVAYGHNTVAEHLLEKARTPDEYINQKGGYFGTCLLYTSPSPRD